MPAGSNQLVSRLAQSCATSPTSSTPSTAAEYQEDQVYAGRLTLTEAFLCFASLDRRSCRMNLPLYCVRRVERLNVQRSGVFALSLIVWHGMKIVGCQDAM